MDRDRPIIDKVSNNATIAIVFGTIIALVLAYFAPELLGEVLALVALGGAIFLYIYC